MKKESSKSTKVTKSITKVQELTADLQRVQAEFINYKRRAELDKIRAMELGKEQTAKALLPILDSLERAIAHEPVEIKDHAWVQGIGSVAKQLDSQLASIGLKKVGVIGDVFDPNLHEAVSMVDGEGDTEVIIGVAQTGYMLGDVVIRHAMVQVGKQ